VLDPGVAAEATVGALNPTSANAATPMAATCPSLFLMDMVFSLFMVLLVGLRA
jgi:hypothetical protein